MECAPTARRAPNTVAATAGEQYQAARSGNGGFCFRNPFSSYGAATQPRPRYRRNY
jgi:hypothetical protein